MKTLIVIILLFFNNIAFSQPELNFLGCTPAKELGDLDSMNTYVYTCRHDSLLIVRKLIYFKDQICTNVKYLNNRYIALIFKSINVGDSTKLVILPFSDTGKIRQYALGSINIYSIGWFYKKTSNNEMYMLIDCYDYAISKEKFLSVDLETGSKSTQTMEVLQDNFYSEGSRTIYSDWTSLYVVNRNGSYFIDPIIYGDNPIKISLALPEHFFSHKLVISVNTNNFLVYTLKNDFYNEKLKIGQQELLVKDKRVNEWKTFTIKGDLSSYALYNEWLAGEVINYYSNHKKIVSPGLNLREQKNRETGVNIDKYFSEKGIYCPGVLFLLNIKTSKYIEWDALENGEHQGDSEIILVQDDTVYYRINDKIYKAPIINGEKLGEPVLLVTDPRVPDIHWAFLAKDQSFASPDIK